jgi:hypothetical protein
VAAAPAPAAVPATQPTAGRPAGPEFASQDPTVVTSTMHVVGDDALSRRLAQQVQNYPHDVSGQVDYQMLKFVRGEAVPQLDTLAQLPQTEREIVSAVMDGLSNWRTSLRGDANVLPSRQVRPLLEMADRIRALAELTIPNVVLCSEVRGFGVYEPMPNTFRAGQDNPVILYCEVQNFSSVQNDKLLWETRLSQEVVLYTETGFPVWRDKTAIPADQSRNRRHDFYVFKRVTLPKTLSVGRYVLKVSIVDEQAKRVAENSTAVLLVAQ